MSSDTDHDVADIPGELADENTPLNIFDEELSAVESSPSRLSTIPEGSNEAESLYPTFPTYLQGCLNEKLWEEMDNNAKQCIQEHAEIK